MEEAAYARRKRILEKKVDRMMKLIGNDPAKSKSVSASRDPITRCEVHEAVPPVPSVGLGLSGGDNAEQAEVQSSKSSYSTSSQRIAVASQDDIEMIDQTGDCVADNQAESPDRSIFDALVPPSPIGANAQQDLDRKTKDSIRAELSMEHYEFLLNITILAMAILMRLIIYTDLFATSKFSVVVPFFLIHTGFSYVYRNNIILRSRQAIGVWAQGVCQALVIPEDTFYNFAAILYYFSTFFHNIILYITFFLLAHILVVLSDYAVNIQ